MVGWLELCSIYVTQCEAVPLLTEILTRSRALHMIIAESTALRHGLLQGLGAKDPPFWVVFADMFYQTKLPRPLIAP
jgi:hypothetical protein